MNENITTKDLLNLILENQETPKTTESKEMELEQAISYFLANQIKNSDDTLKYYKIEFNCLKTYFKMFEILRKSSGTHLVLLSKFIYET